MTLFAHIENGVALDVQANATRDDYLARFSAAISAGWVVSQVPDGTIHGAKDNGNGTFANPPVASPTPIPRTLSASEFQDVCETGLGGGIPGATRFGTVMQAMASSNDGLVISAYQRFVKSLTFDKSKAQPLFLMLTSKGILNAGEGNAMLSQWPTNAA